MSVEVSQCYIKFRLHNNSCFIVLPNMRYGLSSHYVEVNCEKWLREPRKNFTIKTAKIAEMAKKKKVHCILL